MLLVHGFPDDATTWDPVAEVLVDAGFRVVIPTMRGYAPSGISKTGRYDAETLGTDLLEIADHVSPDEPVCLVGHDWGAVASFAAVGMRSQRVSHLATLAVPHPRALLANLSAAQLRRSWYMGRFQLFSAERALSADRHALVERLWRDWSPSYQATQDELDRVKQGIAGRERDVIAYYRALLSKDAWLGASRRALFSPVRVPAIHLHGAEDGCIGLETNRGADKWYRAGYRLYTIEQAGHFVQRERPDLTGRILLEFLPNISPSTKA